MAGAGGGAWKVAYADFVTAMMAFFMVLWITSQSDDVKQAVAGYFKEPPGSNSKTAPASVIPLLEDTHDSASPKPGEDMPSLDLLLKRMKGDYQTPMEVRVLHDGERRTLGVVVTFDWLSTELSAANQKLLDHWISLARGQRSIIEIRGHTTLRPIPADSPIQDKWQFSFARSMTVMKYLEKGGINPDRFRLSQAAGNEPLTISEDAIKQSQNARVDVYELGETVDDSRGTREERKERFKIPIALPTAPHQAADGRHK